MARSNAWGAMQKKPGQADLLRVRQRALEDLAADDV